MANAWNEILETMREEGKFYNEPSFFIGKIIEPLPNIKIRLSDMDLVKSQLLIDKTLLDRHNFSVSCSEGSISHNLNDRLNVGDKVVLIFDEDKFIIISKVVSI